MFVLSNDDCSVKLRSSFINRADGEKATEQAAKAPEPSDKMMAVLSKVMYYATREESKEVNEAGSSVYFMLLRSLIASAGGPEEVSAANTETPSGKQTPTKQPKNGKSGSQNASKAALCAKDAIDACIEEVFEKRKTLWGYSELNMFMSKAPESLPELMLPSVLDKACSARTQHLQLLALKVCNACMKYVSPFLLCCTKSDSFSSELLSQLAGYFRTVAALTKFTSILVLLRACTVLFSCCVVVFMSSAPHQVWIGTLASKVLCSPQLLSLRL